MCLSGNIKHSGRENAFSNQAAYLDHKGGNLVSRQLELELRCMSRGLMAWKAEQPLREPVSHAGGTLVAQAYKYLSNSVGQFRNLSLPTLITSSQVAFFKSVRRKVSQICLLVATRMDPLGAAATVLGLFHFVRALLKTFDGAIDSKLVNIVGELKILSAILKECAEAIESNRYSPNLRASVELSLQSCLEKQRELMLTLKRILPAEDEDRISRAVRRTKVFLESHGRHQSDAFRASYKSFRDSILLLRDLASDIRTMNGFREMQELVLRIVINNLEHQEHDHDEAKSSPGAMPDGGTRSPTPEARVSKHQAPTTSLNNDSASQATVPHPRNVGQDTNKSPENIDRVKNERTYERFLKLARFDYACTVILAFEHQGVAGVDRWRFQPVRAVADSGTKHCLINRKVLVDYKFDMSKVVPITEEDGIPATLQTLDNNNFVTKEKVSLLWYGESDRVERRNTFIVVDNEVEFRIIIAMNTFLKEPDAAFPVLDDHWPWRRHRDSQRQIVDDSSKRKANQRFLQEFDSQPTSIEPKSASMNQPTVAGPSTTTPVMSHSSHQGPPHGSTLRLQPASPTPSQRSIEEETSRNDVLVQPDEAAQAKTTHKQKKQKGKGKERERENGIEKASVHKNRRGLSALWHRKEQNPKGELLPLEELNGDKEATRNIGGRRSDEIER
ncbi:hypothetical protein QBC43DRAFT_360164 [Cladorrhinum sp. PSN259]|nr:hypothetical protein QBC43DRAFT_360164 [Cladorrhinum sp. PSN259]